MTSINTPDFIGNPACEEEGLVIVVLDLDGIGLQELSRVLRSGASTLVAARNVANSG